jgi:hypothetical protein
MNTYTINSRKFGKQIFTAPSNGGYVRVNGSQICAGGHMIGSTVRISAAGNLEAVAKNWWKQYLRNQNPSF